jgi:hypothetical protein
MRYERADYEWSAIKPMLPNKPRAGLTGKIHAVVDTNGLPVRLAVTPGERQHALR